MEILVKIHLHLHQQLQFQMQLLRMQIMKILQMLVIMELSQMILKNVLPNTGTESNATLASLELWSARRSRTCS